TETLINRKKFLSQYAHEFSKDQLENVDDDGIVRIGSEVKEGDPLVLVLRK
ncbi:MAG: hypothetical protein GWO27_04155, partial [Thermoplasmata archaeon]|nr:hypothetical protein [Thermoplasmata archaeon]